MNFGKVHHLRKVNDGTECCYVARNVYMNPDHVLCVPIDSYTLPRCRASLPERPEIRKRAFVARFARLVRVGQTEKNEIHQPPHLLWDKNACARVRPFPMHRVIEVRSKPRKI